MFLSASNRLLIFWNSALKFLNILTNVISQCLISFIFIIIFLFLIFINLITFQSLVTLIYIIFQFFDGSPGLFKLPKIILFLLFIINLFLFLFFIIILRMLIIQFQWLFTWAHPRHFRFKISIFILSFHS